MSRKKRGLVFYEKKKLISGALLKELLSMGFYTAIAISAAALIAQGFGYRSMMNGSSMSPGIESGETVFIDRVSYKLSSPKRGDVIAFYPNGNKGLGLRIKRIVAIPGETVVARDGVLYINDIPEADPDKVYDAMIDGGIAEKGLTLGTGEVFVLGDRRNASEDSRNANIGAVTYDSILGKVWFHTGEL